MDRDPVEPRQRASKTKAPAPLPDRAIVTVTLERATGKVELDTEFSTPAETAIMLDYANDIAAELLDEANGRERAEDG